MPADLLVNAICLRNWPDMTLHEIVGPIGLLSPHRLAGEDVLVAEGEALEACWIG